MPNSRHSAKKDVAEHRYAGQPMPSAALLPRAWHSAKKSFAESFFLSSARHSAKNSLPSAILCRVQHSAKKVFAECPIFDTRQRILHSAKSLFLVVGLGCRTAYRTHTSISISNLVAERAGWDVFFVWLSRTVQKNSKMAC